jgi:hypothetical protein
MKLHTYTSNITGLLRSLTENENGNGDLIATPPGVRTYQEIEIHFDYGKVTLLFELGNLYLQGFRNKGNELFIFEGVNYAVNPAKKFTQSTDYGQLGLDRNSDIYLSLTELSNALNTLLNIRKADNFEKVKKPMWQCAVGLSEALRFQDAAMAVMHNTKMPSLDWSSRTKANDFRVRVKHR